MNEEVELRHSIISHFKNDRKGLREVGTNLPMFSSAASLSENPSPFSLLYPTKDNFGFSSGWESHKKVYPLSPCVSEDSRGPQYIGVSHCSVSLNEN
jgi:hypothetical protein